MLLMCMHKQITDTCSMLRMAPVLCQWPLQAGQHSSLDIGRGLLLRVSQHETLCKVLPRAWTLHAPCWAAWCAKAPCWGRPAGS